MVLEVVVPSVDVVVGCVNPQLESAELREPLTVTIVPCGPTLGLMLIATTLKAVWALTKLPAPFVAFTITTYGLSIGESDPLTTNYLETLPDHMVPEPDMVQIGLVINVPALPFKSKLKTCKMLSW